MARGLDVTAHPLYRMTIRLVCCAAFIAASAGGSSVSAAPPLTCYTVQRGDTAARIALRLTRNARNIDAPWFQIFNPSASAFIPKNQYRHIQPGWQACLAGPTLAAPPTSSRPSVAAPARVPVFVSAILRWWWAPTLFVTTAFAWIATQNYLDKRQAISRVLERFGLSFIREFERPLLHQPGVESPLRSSLRIVPDRNWLEILLAPNDGWHYPNLTDHRKNLEYDVERIVTLLGERRFVCGQLGTRGPWVVIPFRLEGPLKKEERA
jgi:hypothetical protein